MPNLETSPNRGLITLDQAVSPERRAKTPIHLVGGTHDEYLTLVDEATGVIEKTLASISYGRTVMVVENALQKKSEAENIRHAVDMRRKPTDAVIRELYKRHHDRYPGKKKTRSIVKEMHRREPFIMELLGNLDSVQMNLPANKLLSVVFESLPDSEFSMQQQRILFLDQKYRESDKLVAKRNFREAGDLFARIMGWEAQMIIARDRRIAEQVESLFPAYPDLAAIVIFTGSFHLEGLQRELSGKKMNVTALEVKDMRLEGYQKTVLFKIMDQVVHGYPARFAVEDVDEYLKVGAAVERWRISKWAKQGAT